MKHILKVILPIMLCVFFASCKENAKSELAQGQKTETEAQDTVRNAASEQSEGKDSLNVMKQKITKEMAFEGVNHYCHKSYDWSVAKDNPDIMYVQIGEETDSAYQVVFRSYTGAFVHFYVNKTSGTTKMVEKVPSLNVEEEAGTINLFDYLKKQK